MKPRELLYLLGIRPRPRTYPWEVRTCDLPADGRVEYAQWLHPGESDKPVRQAVIDELRRFIAPGDVAIDIGAHTGDSTIPMALAAGAGGAVLALEPNPYVFPVLEQNAALNPGRYTIVPLRFAAMPAAGDYEFEYSDAGFCNGGLHQGISRWRHGHAFRLAVRGVHLPTYLAGRFPALVPRVRFVKVDAEGNDYAVLASLVDLLRERQPFIRAEVFKLLSVEQRERLYDFLVNLGYEVHLVESEAHYRGRRLGRRDLMTRRHYDIFCVPEGRTSG